MGYDLRTHNRTGRSHEEILDSVEPNPDDPIAFAEAVYQALIDNGDDFTWNSDAWPRLLRMAQSYGWKPAGTDPPYSGENPERGFPPDFSKPWNGTYLYNDG